MRAGYAVVLEDVLSSNLRHAEQALRSDHDAGSGILTLASSVEDAVREADLAIDFVPDELESKLEIFSMMDRMAPPRTVFCTPTALSISDLASCTYRASKCIALRFTEAEGSSFELIRGIETSPETAAAVEQWLESLQSRVRVVDEESLSAGESGAV